jgi:hypothetical protein
MENQSESTNKFIVQYILMALLIIISGISIYLGVENQNLKDALIDCGDTSELAELEKNQVMESLRDLSAEYDSMMTNNDSINAELIEEKKRVDELMAQAKKYNWSIYKLKKEAATLREIMKGYVRTIDSLNMENVELRAENMDVKNQLGQVENKNKSLMETTKSLEDKVRLGAKLSTTNFAVEGQRVRSNNIHKEINRASKTEKLRACFTIDANEVTEPGKKTIYLRIITPEGTVLSERADNNHTFPFEGTKGLYSVKKEINYENVAVDLCMYWDVTTPLVPGEYLFKAYESGQEIGSATLILK